MGVSGLGDTQIYEVAPPAEVAPDGWIVGRGDGPAGSGGSHDDQGAGGARDDAERDRPAAGCDGGGGAASPPAHGGGGGGRAVIAAAAGGEPGGDRALAVAAERGWGGTCGLDPLGGA